MVLEPIESCENCGRSIGKLEKVCVWGQSVVCVDCRKKLESESTQSLPKTSRRLWNKASIATGVSVSVASLAIFTYLQVRAAKERHDLAEKQKIEAYFHELEDVGIFVYNEMIARSISAGPNLLTARLRKLSGERYLLVIQGIYPKMIEYRTEGKSNDEIIAATKMEAIIAAEETIGKDDADAYLRNTQYLKPP